jgi:hypothetical protein
MKHCLFNINRFEVPECNLDDDHCEDIAGCADHPGKVMAVNDNDGDCMTHSGVGNDFSMAQDPA